MKPIIKFFAWCGILASAGAIATFALPNESVPISHSNSTVKINATGNVDSKKLPVQHIVNPKTTDSYWQSQTFTYGETSEKVRQLQDYLKTKGYFSQATPSTGYFGSTTNTAYSKLTGHTLTVPQTTYHSSGSNLFGTGTTYSPTAGCAENGSCYGDINQYGIPKTIHVNGYYRKDGTYVRGHYRGAPRY